MSLSFGRISFASRSFVSRAAARRPLSGMSNGQGVPAMHGEQQASTCVLRSVTFASSARAAGTTILCVRKDNKVAMMGDGQVSLGNMVVKPNAKKVRCCHYILRCTSVWSGGPSSSQFLPRRSVGSGTISS